MRDVKNLKEAKELAAKYKELSKLRELPDKYEERSIYHLTGFGRRNKCTLCIAVNSDCTLCIWGPKVKNCINSNYETIQEYNGDLGMIQGLLRTRAKLLTNRIKSWEEEN